MFTPGLHLDYTWIYKVQCTVFSFVSTSAMYLPFKQKSNRTAPNKFIRKQSKYSVLTPVYLLAYKVSQSMRKLSLTLLSLTHHLDVPWWVRHEAQHRLFSVLGLITLFWAALLNWPAAQLPGFPGDLGSPVMSWSETTITYNNQSTYKPFV